MTRGCGITDGTVLSVTELQAHYGKSHVLQGVSLAVGHGEVVAVLGRNGVGKTTTVRCISGGLRATSGGVWLAGEGIVGMRSEDIARRGVGLVPQGRRLFGSLSVNENLTVVSRTGSGSRTRVADVYGLFPALEPLKSRAARLLSGGEQQMLAIGRALMTDPRLLLMDEPSEGLSGGVASRLAGIVKDLASAGRGILVVEQNVAFALRIADRILIMNRGLIVQERSRAELGDSADATNELLLGSADAGTRPDAGS